MVEGGRGLGDITSKMLLAIRLAVCFFFSFKYIFKLYHTNLEFLISIREMKKKKSKDPVLEISSQSTINSYFSRKNPLYC